MTKLVKWGNSASTGQITGTFTSIGIFGYSNLLQNFYQDQFNRNNRNRTSTHTISSTLTSTSTKIVFTYEINLWGTSGLVSKFWIVVMILVLVLVIELIIVRVLVQVIFI